MADVVDKPTRSRMMAGIRGKNTIPEVFLRKTLHAMGFRYCLGGRGLPGKPDLVLSSYKVVIFVHGCFWHMHDCKYFRWPSSNEKFWKEKLGKNAKRDRKVVAQLENLGWKVLIVWECELKETKYKMPNPAINRIAGYLISQRLMASKLS